VWIVEGEIKADLVALWLGAFVVSIPGVSSWSLALDDLAELLPNGGSVVVALDADWRKNAQVHTAAWSLAQACTALGYRTEVALWGVEHKGLDDLLVAGLSPLRTAVADMPPPTWAPKISARVLAPRPPRRAAKPPPTLAEAREKLRRVMRRVVGRRCPSC
jgi:hypothetical protein